MEAAGFCEKIKFYSSIHVDSSLSTNVSSSTITFERVIPKLHNSNVRQAKFS